VIEASECDVSK